MNRTWEDEALEIREAIARFPATFKLAAYPEETFRISETASYFSGDTLLLYTEIKHAGETWHSFCKGTEQELRKQIR